MSRPRDTAEALSLYAGSDVAVENWLRHVAVQVANCNNDAHARNDVLMHQATGAELAQVHYGFSNLFLAELVKWDLVLAVNEIFDHRRLSVESILEKRILGA